MSWWESAYRSGRVPWDPGSHDAHLPELLERYRLHPPARVLDAGCGNGKSAVWLAERGFSVVGVDLSPTAIAQARRRAHRHGVETRTTFLDRALPDEIELTRPEPPLEQDSFDLVLERAFLQHLGHGRRLSQTVELLHRLTKPNGLFYSLMIAAEGASGYGGIVRWNEGEIRDALEPCFRLEEMRRDVFTPGEPGSVAAWITVLRPL